MKQGKLIAISVVVGLFALVLGSTAALGQESTSQIGDRFQVRLANILGIDTTTLVNAFSQARTEVKTQQIEQRIQELLASGKITEDQVDEVREKMQNRKIKPLRPDGLSGYGSNQVSTQLT